MWDGANLLPYKTTSSHVQVARLKNASPCYGNRRKSKIDLTIIMDDVLPGLRNIAQRNKLNSNLSDGAESLLERHQLLELVMMAICIKCW